MQTIDPKPLLQPLRELHDNIRDAVVLATEQQDLAELSLIERDAEGDTIYRVDEISEAILIPFFERLSRDHSFVLIAEGLAEGKVVYPKGFDEAAATWRIIVDPID